MNLLPWFTLLASSYVVFLLPLLLLQSTMFFKHSNCIFPPFVLAYPLHCGLNISENIRWGLAYLYSNNQQFYWACFEKTTRLERFNINPWLLLLFNNPCGLCDTFQPTSVQLSNAEVNYSFTWPINKKSLSYCDLETFECSV